MDIVGQIHGGYVHRRRVRVLTKWLAEVIPAGARVLDVGCGDGLVSRLIQERRTDVSIEGVDVLLREGSHIPVQPFDGTRLPFADNAFDVVMMVDVLHHTLDPAVLLQEAHRVAKNCVVLKDHALKGFLAGTTLRLMDWVGNARHKVVLPYNYWRPERWSKAFDEINLSVARWIPKLRLYPWWATWAFDRSLHFVARLDVNR